MLKSFLIFSFCILSYNLEAHPLLDDFLYVEAHHDDTPTLNIINSDNDFKECIPHFNITSDRPYDYLWWQISSSPDFPADSTFENICPSNDCITLSEREETFLDSQTTYFFRAKGGSDDFWGDWSDSFTFTINRPQSKKRLQVRRNQQIQKHVYSHETPPTEYERNPFVSEETWNTLSPYFIPEHFPEKAVLDKIFSQRRVLSSHKSMIKSGFILLTHKSDKIIVAKHPYLKGFLIKAYSDEMEAPDWYWWKKRIDGVRIIEEKIVQCGYQNIMKTPKKWIYPLPAYPSPKYGAPYRKNFILVVEDMNILRKKHNLKAYKKKMTPQILDALYIMLMDLKLLDSIYADNTPFCKDGKLAFIDTEHSLDITRPVPITSIAQYLSPEMYSYWEQLYINGGPQR